MRAVIIALAVLTLTGCAHSDPWSKRDTVLQVTYTGMVVIDAIQTSDIQYHDNLVEGGPIARRVLGANPSTSDTWQYLTTVAISHYLITRALPAKWRPWWQGVGIADETSAIFKNCANGLGKICEDW